MYHGDFVFLSLRCFYSPTPFFITSFSISPVFFSFLPLFLSLLAGSSETYPHFFFFPLLGMFFLFQLANSSSIC